MGTSYATFSSSGGGGGGGSTGDLTVTANANLGVAGGTGAVNGSGTNLTLTGASLIETTSSVLAITGGTNAVLGTGVTLQVKQAATAQSGYLSSTDWNTFNGKFTLPALTAGSVLFSDGATLVQDNANFFWDETNKALLIGANAIISNEALLVQQTHDSISGGFALKGIAGGTSDYLSFSLLSNGNFFLYNPFQNKIIQEIDAQGNISWGGANVEGADNLDSFLIRKQAGSSNSLRTLSLLKDTSQTGDFLTALDTDGLAVLANIDIAGVGNFSDIVDNGLTASTVPYADAGKKLVSSAVTPTELGFVHGVTSAIQTQLNAKGTGSVTSVAMTVPSVLSISGSPITGSGTLALSYSGTALPVANGGTGQTTAAAAFNALSPITTTGDIIYSPSGATSQRLGIGSTGNVLTVSGGVPAWAPPATAGTVTAVAVVSANGLAGSSSGGATPALTLSTSITGVLKGNGTAISAAASGTDYQAPIGSSTPVSHQFLTGFTAPNTFAQAQPAFTDISGIATVAQVTIAAQAISATAIDWSTGTVFTQSNGSTSRTFTFSNQTSGQTIVVRLTQTSGTVTWPTVKWPSGVAPTATASGTDVYTFIYDGTSTYGSAVQNMS